MLKPYIALQLPTLPLAAIARTRAYREYGLPVIHGSVTGTLAAGDCRDVSSQRIALPAKVGLVASTNS
jgi:hypothetical protein